MNQKTGLKCDDCDERNDCEVFARMTAAMISAALAKKQLGERA